MVNASAAYLSAPAMRAISIAADASDPRACAALIQGAITEFGRLDILVCNAGIILPNAAESATPEELERTLRTNIGGYLYCAQAAEPYMTRQGGGSIVMTSSNASLVAFPDLLTYNISKAGVDQMVRQPVRALVELSIGAPFLASNQGQTLRTGVDDNLEEVREVEGTVEGHRPEK